MRKTLIRWVFPLIVLILSSLAHADPEEHGPTRGQQPVPIYLAASQA